MDYASPCLLLETGTGRPLDDETRSILISAASTLYAKRNKEFRFTSHAFDGTLTTNWRECTIGEITGFAFKADVEDEHGIHTMSVLIDETHLRRGAEIIGKGYRLVTEIQDPVPMSAEEYAQVVPLFESALSTRH